MDDIITDATFDYKKDFDGFYSKENNYENKIINKG
jgi:hypothetical protein